jgi:hypothetical protein
LDKVLSLNNERKTSFLFALCSLNRTFNCVEGWLRLRKTKINFVFRSACTTFAADYQGVPTGVG